MELDSATLRYVRGPRTVPRKLRALLAVEPSGVLARKVTLDMQRDWKELERDCLVSPALPVLDAVVVVPADGDAPLPTAIESKICGASNILFFLARQAGLDGLSASQQLDTMSLDAVCDAVVSAVSQCPAEQRATPVGRRAWLDRHAKTNLEALNFVAQANDNSARFIVGRRLSVADVVVWACVKAVEDFDAGYAQTRFPHLHQFAGAFETKHRNLRNVP